MLDDHTVAYLDIVGSGAETIAHLRDNGRICVMFCSFEGPPRILRLHGQGEACRPATGASRSCSRWASRARGRRGDARDHPS